MCPIPPGVDWVGHYSEDYNRWVESRVSADG